MDEEKDQLNKEINKLIIIKDLELIGFKYETVSHSQTLQMEKKTKIKKWLQEVLSWLSD